MDLTESVVERTYRELGVDGQRPLFPREGIDPDATLVEQLRGGDVRAVEVLVGAYGIASTAWPFASRATHPTPRRSCRTHCGR